MQVQHRRAGSEHVVLSEPQSRRGHRAHRVACTLAGQAEDLGFGAGVGISDPDVHQEPVELRLGQRERALLLDRILCRHHQEQRRQRIGRAADGDLAFAHRLKQGRLHLGRRAVDLVGEQDRVEDRSRLELEAAILRAPDLGAGEVGG